MPPHSDIASPGWFALLPARLVPYALLARLDRPVGIWLLFLPGAWGILLARPAPSPGPSGPWGRLPPEATLLALFALGSVVMRAAGCVVNDWWDRDLDRRIPRTAGRPLASGALGTRQAALFLVLLLAIGLGVLSRLDPACRILGAAILLPVGLYPLAKRVTRAPQLALGLVFGFGAPMGWVAARGGLAPAAAWLYAAAIAWDVGFDTIYAQQDRDGDASLGLGSTALLAGGQGRAFVGGCYAAMLACLAVAFALAGSGRWGWVGLAASAGSLALQVAGMAPDRPERCLALFRANRQTGTLVALAILAGRF